MTADPALRTAGPGTTLDVPTVAAHGRAVLDEVATAVVGAREPLTLALATME